MTVASPREAFASKKTLSLYRRSCLKITLKLTYFLEILVVGTLHRLERGQMGDKNFTFQNHFDKTLEKKFVLKNEFLGKN